MKKINNTYGAEYNTPQENQIPFEHIAPAEEYVSIAPEYIAPAEEYISFPEEYADTHMEEASTKKEKKKPFVSKNKFVYFVASTAASFAVFSAALGGGLFGPGNTIGIVENITSEQESELQEDVVPDTGNGVVPDTETDVPPAVQGSYKGILLTDVGEILGAKNYLIAFYKMQENKYGVMNYKGDVLYENTCVGIPKVQGPNEMGYTTFYHSGEESNVVEIVDAYGRVVYTRKDNRTEVAMTQLGDCDILYELLPEKESNDYVKYTKLDGTVVFDSREYTDKKVTGYPFCNGQALIVADTTATNNGYYTLWVIDYSGNVKKLPNIMSSGARVFGMVDDYFMLRSGSSYALVTTETGEISNWLDLKKCAETLGETGLRFSSTLYNHYAVYCYGTRAILSENYIIDFKEVTPEGTVSTYIKTEYEVYPTLSEILVAGLPEYNEKLCHYIDWNGNKFTPGHSFAYEVNDSGYAMVSDNDNDNDMIYVYDKNFNVVEALPGIIFTSESCGDFVVVSFYGEEQISGYYYYGTLSGANVRYNGPKERHAGSTITTEIPKLDKIEYVTIENEAQLQKVSQQLEELRTALSNESNSHIPGRDTMIGAIKEILTNAETLYFIACTDNATMKNYSDMKSKMKTADLAFYYMSDLIECYEEKKTFQSYYGNYLGYHIKTAPAAMKVIYEKIELIKEEERTELQEYALGVAGNLLEIFKDKKENLEKLFNYTTELAEANSGSKVFLSEYNKNKDSITEYWELSPNLNWWPVWLLGGGMG